jgi:serine/threonine protein kinase/tetratricopeptide (TPR) repeat protein
VNPSQHLAEAMAVPPPNSDTQGDSTQLPAGGSVRAGESTLGHADPGTPRPTTSDSVRAGRYCIIRLHARGGLGEVYLARDEELGREVAIKRLRPQHADQPKSRRRFITEAAVTARLDHPGVVPVHGLVRDADGRPAYAMRFIEGDTLADAIAHFHGAAKAASPRSTGEIILSALGGSAGPRYDSLDFRQLLGRFVAACNAIAFAHSKGVIHRDLKPANVMLGPYGETLVVDWGLAKELADREKSAAEIDIGGADESSVEASATDSTETAAGEILGTPAFMAPEQAAAGVVGLAADVYSLGAMLYMMLVGQAPTAARSAGVAVQRARLGQFPPPRQLRPAVPRPLDAICRKAMAFNPADRYESALALASDVERWLADEPVSSDEETGREKVRRWARRHRPVVAAGIALLTTAVIGLTAATWLISREETATAQAKTRAEQQRDRADRNLKLAARAVDTAAQRVSDHPRLRAGDFHDLRADLLAALIPFYEELTRQSGDDPAVEFQGGLAYERLGNLRRDTGQMDKSERAFRSAVEVFSRLADREPRDSDVRRRLAEAHGQLGLLLTDLNRPADARSELETAVKIDRDLSADAGDTVARRSLVSALNGLAMAVQAGPRPTDAEPIFQEALDISATLLRQAPNEGDLVALAANVENNFGVMLRRAGRAPEAEALFRTAVARRTALAKSTPADPTIRRQLVVSHFNLGNVLLATNRRAEAETEYKAAIGVAEKLATDFTSVPDYRADLGRALANLATMYGMSDRPADAVAPLRRSAEIFDRLVTDFPANEHYRHNRADSWYNVGEALAKLKRYKDSDAAYRTAADEYARLAAEAPEEAKRTAELAVTWVTLGDLARSARNDEAAVDWYDKAIARLGASPGEGALRDAHMGRAEILAGRNQFAEAIKDWDAAIAVAEQDRRPGLRLRRTRTLVAAGQPDKAASEVKELVVATKADSETLDAAARVLALAAGKADATSANGYAAEAVALLRRAQSAGHYRQKGARDELQNDPDFAALRGRDDFRGLVKEVGK